MKKSYLFILNIFTFLIDLFYEPYTFSGNNKYIFYSSKKINHITFYI
jgi:hypothetical protein